MHNPISRLIGYHNTISPVSTLSKALCAVSALGLAVCANADVAYSTLGQTYSGGGYYVGGNGFDPAFEFNSAASGALTDVDLVVGNADGSSTPQWFLISLLSDNAGTPGAVLGSWGASTNQDYRSTVTQSYTTNGPILAAGQNYWLMLTGTNTDIGTTVVWDATNDSTTEGFSDYSPIYGFENTPIPGFANTLYQVNVQPAATPEPASVAVLGLGALGLLIRRKKK